jgi:hypothetical protein
MKSWRRNFIGAVPRQPTMRGLRPSLSSLEKIAEVAHFLATISKTHRIPYSVYT